jgi:hypothetical protein
MPNKRQRRSLNRNNGSFEVWLILHFREWTRFLDNAKAAQIRAECDDSSDKSVNGRLYMDRRAEAIDRAQRLDREHRLNGTVFPNDNPSSGMFKLLRSVQP